MEQIMEAVETKTKRRPIRGLLYGLAVLAAVYLGLCAYASGVVFYPNCSLNGVRVDGMTAAAAQALIEREVPARRVALADGESGAVLAEVTLAELGYPAEAFRDFAKQQLEKAGDAPFFARGWNWISALTGEESGGWFWPERQEDVFDATVLRLTETLSEAPVAAEVSLTADAVCFTLARDGRAPKAAALDALRDTALYETEAAVPVTLEVVAAGEDADPQEIYDALAGEMANAAYDKASGGVTPERIGLDFDVEAARNALSAALPGETVRVDARVEYPETTAKELEALLFRDVLGECRTPIMGEDGRVTNIRLSAAAINECVLMPGEEFSYNQVVGKRTAAKGYQEGPAYVNGKTVMEIGGGICQTSSTLYLACLRADLKIVERKNHGYVPAYIPWGMDSAVSWGGPDYRFVNNKDYPVKIVTAFDGESVEVKILGTNPDGRYADVTFEVLSTTPWTTTEYVEDPTLAPGSEGVVMVDPYTGAKVRTTHIIYDADGNVLDSHIEATSNYKMRNQVIHVPVGEIPVEADN